MVTMLSVCSQRSAQAGSGSQVPAARGSAGGERETHRGAGQEQGRGFEPPQGRAAAAGGWRLGRSSGAAPGACAGKDQWCWERLEINLEATCTGRLEVQADRRLRNPGRILGKAWEGA